ncbi:unnamed protein product, partial [Closterium sp. NIES-53]
AAMWQGRAVHPAPAGGHGSSAGAGTSTRVLATHLRVASGELLQGRMQESTQACMPVPPCGKGALYIRPLLVGTGPVLGLAPAPEYSLLIYVSPVGNYFKGATLTPIALKVEELYHRAAPGGTGSAKAIGNYSPVEELYHRAAPGGTGSAKAIGNYSPVSAVKCGVLQCCAVSVAVGNYFKGAKLTPIALKVEELYHRAAPGGTGSAKAIGNYSPVSAVLYGVVQCGAVWCGVLSCAVRCCAVLTPIALKVEELYHRAAPGGIGSAKAIGNYSPVSVVLYGVV